MPPVRDLAGETFGRLLVQGRSGSTRHGKATWDCLCECGRPVTALGALLANGKTRSCGCYRREATAARSMVHGHALGGRRSSVLGIHHGMLQRCLNPNDSGYQDYGERGISVCGYFRVFANFLTDMGDRPVGMSIDRIDNDGNYSCGHCDECLTKGWNANLRWADPVTQANNRRPRR